ncbi:MAG: efflux RND transporter permease subunit [Clostridiales bacterium]|nr:efflux RND transporter permease subunit [Clostridiales bacterium]
MVKQCVKKPFTVLVAVIIALVLGVVCMMRMTTDLLPEMSLPYMVVITTYPGASPEKVEANVTEPLESALGTVSGVENVTSSSAENYSMIMLEFEDDTDMDSAMVKVDSALQDVESSLPDLCGTPNVMEISMDMVATMYVSVDYEGKDIYALSDFVEDIVTPYFERQDGVASVSTVGLVEQTVEVRLNQDKIDAINNKLLASVLDTLEETKQEIDDAQAELADAQAELDDGTTELEDQQEETSEELAEASLALNQAIATQSAYEAQLASQQANQTALETELEAYETAGIQESYEELEALFQTLQDTAASEETYNAIYDAAYSQVLISATQSVVDSMAASGLMESVTVTEDNVDTILDMLDSASAAAYGASASDTTASDAGTSSAYETLSALPEEQLLAYLSTLSEDEIGALLAGMTEEELAALLPSLSADERAALLALAGTAEETDTENTGNTGDDSGSASSTGVRASLIATAEEAAASVAESQVAEMTASLPTSVEDAIANPEKLDYAVSLLETQGMGEAASALTVENLTTISDIVNTRIPQIETELANLEIKIAVATATVEAVNSAVEEAVNSYTTVEAGKILAAAGFGSASAQLAAAQTALEDGQSQLDSALEAYESARETAIASANLDTLLDIDTLATLIYAQNFSMPAGYVDDADDNQWLLKVGEEYSNLEDLENMVLCNLDSVGDVTLGDVANLTVIDNAADSYTRVNGEAGVVLSIFKGSTAGTSDVSSACNDAIAELEEKYDGLQIQPLMDQGEYISLIISNILESMILGALLAIVILALFLKDLRPTLVVGFSIPFSVLIALLLMYFTDISLNIMSLGGLSLGIGMLVDNSIVAIENIYRLRGRGLPAPRAAVQGVKQVSGALISSTLTTICVFLPMIFTTGYTRELMYPMALTIGYALIASLVVAMTVVPTVASTLLKNVQPKSHRWFDKVVDGYGKVLDFCLRVKVVPLGLAIGLFGVAVFGVARMGMVMIPDMSSNQISITVTMPEDYDQDTAYAAADEVTERILAVDGVDYVGAMTNASSMLTTSATTSNDFLNYVFYVVPSDDVNTEQGIEDICNQIAANTADLEFTVDAASSSSSEMSSMLGSGLEIDIYGSDLDTLVEISEDFMEIISEIEGFDTPTNGQDEADQELVLVVDKDAAMRLGLTVAQIYSEISARLTTESTSTTVTIDGTEMEVVIVDETNLLTRENLMDITFDVDTTDEDGASVTETHTLDEFATVETDTSVSTISRENQQRYISVTADTLDGYNSTRLSMALSEVLEDYEMPDGYTWEMAGEYETVISMMTQMIEMLALGLLFVYLVMVAQFQSLLSPFIILFTVPLAFTGGMFGLMAFGEQLSLLSMIGFLVLMGTVVNNGIVFVDYTNQLRLGGMEKRAALIATGKTRMRPILMTALTTILAMGSMMFSTGISASLTRGMAIVVACGLAYATLMTLFVVPVMYDVLYRRQPREIDVGDDTIDDVPDDAAEFLQQARAEEAARAGK